MRVPHIFTLQQQNNINRKKNSIEPPPHTSITVFSHDLMRSRESLFFEMQRRKYFIYISSILYSILQLKYYKVCRGVWYIYLSSSCAEHEKIAFEEYVYAVVKSSPTLDKIWSIWYGGGDVAVAAVLLRASAHLNSAVKLRTHARKSAGVSSCLCFVVAPPNNFNMG